MQIGVRRLNFPPNPRCFPLGKASCLGRRQSLRGGCVDSPPPPKNRRVFGDSNPFLRREALYLISSSFSLFPHHLLQRHTRLPAAISAWLVRFPINSGAVWAWEARRFGIQSALRIIIGKEHISLTPIRISSRSSRRGRFINNNLLALDS